MENNNNNRAVASLVLGLVSIVTWLFPIAGYITTILAIVFATKGRHSEKKGMATAGLVLGIIFLVVTLLNSIFGAILGVLANL
ncbi:hypothetical protein LG34_11230 [Eubacterium ramulus]|jgi:hypothetical protein|uniref:DUF4190 domain-containing protein n=1 Tax=Eubacterium ramulus TaxID=39490 RepID=A0A2V1JUW5_EUBRA|nr:MULTISPECIES: DUF4190 domain-containing protein [Clostridia]MBS5191030.1 DUF4190 domain-containing protein [Lachnospiraceae bacterium]PWE86268.1 hypothetical protein LG34_11230 [Eubacterium ramulus]RHV67764.1 DUF4190 domain-containing protein [Roseburia sp. OM02-15]